MSHSSKHIHYIPSPFPAVNQYEGEFIKQWNKNTAEEMAEVLKYIATATASAIKEKQIDL